ncbi:MAG: Non specific extracellular endonuclease cleaving [Candidatus Saccharibacteria bacterium]|nr:Non specific extracellular endonuclease cleaving [Candidatus Saccharibacteria bacterium]
MCLPAASLALTTAPPLALPPTLAIAQIKVTGDEFLVLVNNSASNINDLSQYSIESFNNASPLAHGVSSSAQQLPAAELQAGQSLLLSADSRVTCGATVAGDLSLNLADGGGFLQVVKLSLDATGAVVRTPADLVSWTSATSGAKIVGVPTSSKDPTAAFYRYDVGDSYSWQLADVDSQNFCTLDVAVTTGGTVAKQAVDTSLAGQQLETPPATIVSIAAVAGDTPAPSVPARNLHLQPPQITELLPNPAGTGTDSTDEFVELYNANATSFDLSGYLLQTGTTTVHKYAFPGGTSLPAKSFVAFYSEATGFSLSNTGAQLRLADPTGKVIGSSDAYTNAKDGQSWAYAKGKWYWTVSLTPNAANIIKQPVTAKSKAAAKAAKSAGTTAKLASTAVSGSSGGQSALPTPPIHATIVAIVVAVALLYAAYEYRSDLANRLHQLRAKFRRGRGVGR